MNRYCEINKNTYDLVTSIIKLLRSNFPSPLLSRITNAIKNVNTKTFFTTIKQLFNFKNQTAIVTKFKTEITEEGIKNPISLK